MSATDRQSSYSTKLYFGAKTFTIPQYNARLGYFFKDNWEISIGTDHMKYVVEQNQTVPISGYIENTNTIYDDLYENDKVKLEREFLLFEHTDGLNYVNAALRHSFKLVENNKIKFRSLEGVGLGILVPRTNATLLGKKRYDEFHFSG